VPAAVSIIHSFSAADPLDPSTIAGRWLEQGAFVYFGAMNEPYLHAFRPPKLVAELAAAEIPLSAVLRQGEHEFFGRPWRLVYLGDPLYGFTSGRSSARNDRLPPNPSEFLSSGQAHCRVLEKPQEGVVAPPSSALLRLQWCRNAVITSLCHRRDGGASEPEESPDGQTAWRSVLTGIDRQALDPALRPVLDELVIDTLLHGGEVDRLLGWLLKVPADDCPARTWQAIETLVMNRLMARVSERSLAGALTLWEAVLRRGCPAGSPFPAVLTRRLVALVDSDRPRFLQAYRDRLSQLADFLAATQPPLPHSRVVIDELKRVEQAIESPQSQP
jgi:hypothetical protein